MTRPNGNSDIKTKNTANQIEQQTKHTMFNKNNPSLNIVQKGILYFTTRIGIKKLRIARTFKIKQSV
jgi:hypothetical protein